MFKPLSRRLLVTLMGAALLPLAHAQTPPAPQGRVILTISGKIGATNQGNKMVMDMAMLEALPQHSFTTRTPWYDKPVKFTGPLLADVLAAAKASGTTVSAVAINDYAIKIPADDARKFKVVVARLMDDKPMPVRDKGPLFVVYPFDSSADLRTSTYYERSIWQLKALDIQ
jgi:hypothetical protein